MIGFLIPHGIRGEMILMVKLLLIIQVIVSALAMMVPCSQLVPEAMIRMDLSQDM
jgi:hypothetical protein